jgi:hypothetical protein
VDFDPSFQFDEKLMKVRKISTSLFLDRFDLPKRNVFSAPLIPDFLEKKCLKPTKV